MLKEALGFVVSRIIPPNTLSSFDGIGGWYERNPYHRYNEGDVIVLRIPPYASGFGERPVGVIEDYRIVKKLTGRRVGRYFVEMTRDASSEEYRDQLDLGAPVRTRVTEKGTEHFKWNIENLFELVPKGTSPQDALGHYDQHQR